MHKREDFGLLNNKYPIFCGGQGRLPTRTGALDTCQILNHPTKTHLDMDTGRDMSGGVLLESSNFWATGGRLENETALRNAILVSKEGWEQVPDLP